MTVQNIYMVHIVSLRSSWIVFLFCSWQSSWKWHQTDCGGFVQTWVQGLRPRSQMDQRWVLTLISLTTEMDKIHTGYIKRHSLWTFWLLYTRKASCLMVTNIDIAVIFHGMTKNVTQSLLLLNSTMSWVTAWYTTYSTCPLLHASVHTVIQNSPWR